MSIDELLAMAAAHLEAATHDGDKPRKGYEYSMELVAEMRSRAAMIRDVKIRMERPMSLQCMVGVMSDMVEVLK